MIRLAQPLKSGSMAVPFLAASWLLVACDDAANFTSSAEAASESASTSPDPSASGSTASATDASTGSDAAVSCTSTNTWTPPAECEGLRADLDTCRADAETNSASAREQAIACHDAVRAQCEPLFDAVRACREAGTSDCSSERAAADTCRDGEATCAPLDQAVAAYFDACRAIADQLRETCRPPETAEHAAMCLSLADALASCQALEACAAAAGSAADAAALDGGSTESAPSDSAPSDTPPPAGGPAGGERGGRRGPPPGGEHGGPRGEGGLCSPISAAIQRLCGDGQPPADAGAGEHHRPRQSP